MRWILSFGRARLPILSRLDLVVAIRDVKPRVGPATGARAGVAHTRHRFDRAHWIALEECCEHASVIILQ
jgi:hypothetical protein